jgi:heme A synthase
MVLLWIGGTVNPTGSSLACPEWTFICNGELFPEMVGGVLYEHGHRLVATSVGILQIILTVLLWRRRPDLRKLGVALLAMVCFQGALGAVTVGLKLPWVVSTLHLFTAFAYLTALMYTATRVRPEPGEPIALGRTRVWIEAAAIAVLAQILLGGLVRHHEAALASIQLPLHDGSIWPAGAPLALKIHMAHRIGAVLVTLVVIAAAIKVFAAARGQRLLRGLSLAAIGVVLAQVSLGVWTILSYRYTPVAVGHFIGATALWTLWVSMALMTSRKGMST